MKTINAKLAQLVLGTLLCSGFVAWPGAVQATALPTFIRSNPQGIGVIVNGKELVFPDQMPIFYNNRTHVPVRQVFEALGAAVGYDNATKTVTITRGSTSVVLQQGSARALLGGSTVALEQPVPVIGGRTMIPLRFVSEAIGAKVDWDQATSTATISTTDSEITKIVETAPVSYTTSSTSASGAPELSAAVMGQIATDAAHYLGVPYQWGGTTPQTGFDCSGFLYYLFTTHGITSMPRPTSTSLFARGTAVDEADLLPGDLVFFAVNQPGVVSHVGLYVGQQQFISATSSKGIAIAGLHNPYWGPKYLGARRLYK